MSEELKKPNLKEYVVHSSSGAQILVGARSKAHALYSASELLDEPVLKLRAAEHMDW
jgi:hypothetical protein